MSVIDDLAAWLEGQRWYTGSTEPVIRGTWPLLTEEGNLEIALVDAGKGLMCVPLFTTENAYEGDLISSEAGFCYDATSVAAGRAALLAAAASRIPGRGDCLELTGQVSAAPIAASKRLSGEQSNTSIIYEFEDRAPIILKVFRVLDDGPNPDVELTEALGKAGCPAVPPAAGSATGSWLAQGRPRTGHVLTAQEFLPGGEDAWRVFTEAGFDADEERIRELGAATARVHADLREALPVKRAGSDERASLAVTWRGRAVAAMNDAPELKDEAQRIEEVFGRAEAELPWPDLQRIHGDLHLGQVLDVPGKGWVLLDFEGEPLRPLAERRMEDLALRDVAGMLRSFDYVAGHLIAGGADEKAARDLAARARAAFLDGYGPIDHPRLLDALELDKALYEVSYETSQRPDWVGVPLAGIRAILQRIDSEPVSPVSAHPDSSSPSEEPAAPSAASPTDAANAASPTGDDAGAGATIPKEDDMSPENPPVPAVPTEVLAAVAEGRYHAPHDVLGPHMHDGQVTIRVVRHLAESVTIRTADGDVEAEHEYGGIWRASLAAETVPDYRVLARYSEQVEALTDDPYRFLPTVGELDLYLFGEGRHEELWRVLGAHVKHYESALGDVSGTAFAVWAPNARAVRVVGDFNQWDGRSSAMRTLGSSGVWELFLPGAGCGDRYKFEIQYQDGSWHQKADPMARRTEIPPSTASIVTDSDYEWEDGQWMGTRRDTDPLTGPISVYEVHLASWRQGLNFKDLAAQLIGHIKYLGFTHVEFMPVAEHPFGGSWGYQVTSYYAPTSRFGSPDEFRYLINELHKAGIGVIMDWVPAHFPKDSWALARFDGTPLYEDPDPLRGEHPDWGTYVFNYGRREVRNFLVANALYWLEEFHIDGIRVDAVASMLYLDYSREAGQWTPNIYGGRENLDAIAFLQETNATAYRRNPGILMIAEESTSWPGVTAMTDGGGLGFGLKWNMGWMNDTLHYLAEEPINRRYHHGEITFSLVYAFSEQFLLPISHDEVVHGKGSLYRKMPGDHWQKLAGMRALFAYQWAHPGKQLLFMGQEFGQIEEWNEAKGLDWHLTEQPDHDGLMALVAHLNQVYASRPALFTDDFTNHGFEWIEVSDGDHNVLSFVRKSADEQDWLVAIINFAGTPHEDYRVGLPFGGEWDEIVNTDAEAYGGSSVGNLGKVTAEEIPWNGRAHSVSLRLPPLGALYLAPHRD